MRKDESDNTLGQRIYQFLIKPKVVKYSTMIGIYTFIVAIICGVIVAYTFGGTKQGPGTYTIWTNYISDLGSYNYTPIPHFLDYGNMICSIFLIPCLFYLEKQLNPIPQNEEDLKNTSRLRLILGSLGFAWMAIGLIGLFGTGLFSEDRSPFHTHWIFTVVVFFGFAFASFFYGLTIFFYSKKIPKILGLYMFIAPIIMVLILFMFRFQPLHEWLMMFTLYGWITPLSLIFRKEINEELEKN